MKKSLIFLLFPLLLAGCALQNTETEKPKKEITSMKINALNPEQGKKLFGTVFSKPENLPVSFSYNGKTCRGLGDLKLLTNELQGNTRTMTFALDENVQAEFIAVLCPEFGEVEYTLWFRNVGKSASKVLKDVRCIDTVVSGENPVLRGCLGDHEKQYAPYEKDLAAAPVNFCSEGGRATHIVFPYFDFVHGNGGTLMAIGWAGTWTADFAFAAGRTKITACTCNNFNTVLLPGEKVRTGLVVLLPYTGRNADDATNLWRRWWMKYNMPRANAQGDLIQPFSTECFTGDTGLPNSDGSISERHTTWKPTLEKVLQEDVVTDFRWFDAGWYSDPAGNTVESDWWGTVGSWELDKVKWPGKSFLEYNEACHKAGMKVLTWFEPERVTHLEDLVKNYGYKEEWGLRGEWCITSNLGNEECLAWTIGRITKMMGENGVDLFREDNNSDPAGSWRKLDAMETEKYGLPRNGVNENKSIQGHYKLWDSIIDFCGKNGKCTYVDSCASGGGRNDIESMRRGVPFMRSDADRTTTSLRLSMTSTFCKWIPFHGSSTKETVNQLDNISGKGNDSYVNRASLLPVYNLSGIEFNQNRELDPNITRRNLNEWKSIRHLLTKDMYVLTPWHSEQDKAGWTVIAYDSPETRESLLLLFRQEECKTDTFTAKLPFAADGMEYTLADEDTGKTTALSGKILREDGLTVKLESPRSCAMFRITASEK